MKMEVIDRKIINVTGKRQVTIPLKFYERLGLGKEVECFLTHNSVIIRPLAITDDGFSMEILKDLVAQGYGGDELLTKFAEQQTNIKRAVGVLIEEADEIASGKRESVATKDIFGEK
jgi:bifunctional DNA-binding transcriptional regulator/antitoxin component of YhaV-PrlF toxin-antitoxin module